MGGRLKAVTRSALAPDAELAAQFRALAAPCEDLAKAGTVPPPIGTGHPLFSEGRVA